MVGGLTGDLFIQLTTTLAHLSNLTNHHLTGLGRDVSNETLEGKFANRSLTGHPTDSDPDVLPARICRR
jgi:hypothetical protein